MTSILPSTPATHGANERDARQRDIVPPDKLAGVTATIIGVGAIGRQVAIQLGAMGVPRLQLYDFDYVEGPNLGPQAYYVEDLGRSKSAATAEVLKKLNPAMLVDAFEKRFKRNTKDVGDAIFCCVDSIETRRLVWEGLKDRVKFFTDGRMSAEVLRVLSVADPKGREYYPTTLFSASEAFRGSCTAKSTVYCANIAAGLMVGQFTRWLRNMPVDNDVVMNLLATELHVK